MLSRRGRLASAGIRGATLHVGYVYMYISDKLNSSLLVRLAGQPLLLNTRGSIERTYMYMYMYFRLSPLSPIGGIMTSIAASFGLKGAGFDPTGGGKQH